MCIACICITGSGYVYDAAGNVTNDTYNTYQWDAESRLTKVINGAGTVLSLNTYNALGQRVEDVTQTSTTDEAYGAGGNLLVRYTGDSNSRSFVPFNGRLLAEYYCGGTIFDHPDEIGSATTATDCTGNIVNEKLFYPFGELWTGAAIPNLGAHQTFAQLPDYDPETDQYNTPARHYSPSGRWMSPDPGNAGADPSDPQTWNAYAYVRNNPTTLIDPSGLLYCSAADKNNTQNCVTDQEYHRAPDNYKGYTHYNSSLDDVKNVDVTVTNYKGMKGNPAGHEGISVGGQRSVGYTDKDESDDAKAAEGRSVPGAVKPIVPGRQAAQPPVTIDVTPEQADRIQGYINDKTTNPGNYNLFVNNCAQFCSRALQAGDVPVFAPFLQTPGDLINQLQIMLAPAPPPNPLFP
jgi:RHS repeat-associated protein